MVLPVNRSALSEIFINAYILLMIPLLSVLPFTLLKTSSFIKVHFLFNFFDLHVAPHPFKNKDL
ncbi:hypothetical protein NS296_00170 [Pantoea ananatis]|nr:hypothetical protein NS296_00170 [Pantoea ananatis]